MIHPVLSTGYLPVPQAVHDASAVCPVSNQCTARGGKKGKKRGGKKGKKSWMAATLHTSLGDIKIELFCDRVPKTCENFLALAASNYYDNTIFHRNIKGSRPHSPSFFS